MMATSYCTCLLYCQIYLSRILSQLKHPHIVSYHESFFDPEEEYLYIIQDYCDGGNMDDKIKEAARVGTKAEPNVHRIS